MAKYTVYLEDDVDDEIRLQAKHLGMSLAEVIRQRVRGGSHASQIAVLEKKVDSVFALLNYIIADLGYVVGATRAGSRNIQQLTVEAEFYQGNFRRIADSLIEIFQEKNAKGG
jgi:hypothetical protein